MPNQHAILSPSAASRWLSCPASVQLIQRLNLPEETSVYAEEGTKAHALGEIEASLALGLIDGAAYEQAMNQWEDMAPALSPEDRADMYRHALDYVDLILERRDLYPNSFVHLEQRLDSGVPGCWGTSDTVIVSPVHIEIIDFKYGAGVPVSAERNPQLRLYGLGALDTYGDVLGDTEVVRMTVYQPRVSEEPSTEELTADELREWRESVLPIADEALNSPTPHFGPSEKACRWCPVAGDCKARMEKVTQEDFGTDVDLLTPDELGDILHRLPEIKQWVAAVEDAALAKAYSGGVAIPGWKVVLSGGQRQVTNEQGAIHQLTEVLGYSLDEVTTTTVKIKGVGDLEKLVKARARAEGVRPLPRLENVLPDHVAKGEGKPSLAPEADDRPAVDPNSEAQKEFSP